MQIVRSTANHWVSDRLLGAEKVLKEGNNTRTRTRCYLDNASDWRLIVDLDGRLKVTEEVAVTNLRPDMLLISDGTKKMGIVEHFKNWGNN